MTLPFFLAFMSAMMVLFAVGQYIEYSQAIEEGYRGYAVRKLRGLYGYLMFAVAFGWAAWWLV